MKRRKFIGLVVIAGFSLSFLTYLTVDNFKSIIKKILMEDTRLLEISGDAIDQFIVEAERELFFQQFGQIKKWLIIIHFKLSMISKILPFYNKYYQYRSAITGQFLLSTNLFNTKEFNKNKVKYYSFFNPVKMACSNKFSDLYYPQ